MSQAYLIGVVVRLFSIYLVISTLTIATSLFSPNLGLVVNGWTIAGLAIPLLAAAFMWFFNLSIAKRLFFGGSHERALDLTGVVHLEQALFSVLGLWLVCSSLIDCGYWLVLFNNRSSADSTVFVFAIEQKAAMCATFLQAALGLFLMFRANGLARLIQRLRG